MTVALIADLLLLRALEPLNTMRDLALVKVNIPLVEPLILQSQALRNEIYMNLRDIWDLVEIGDSLTVLLEEMVLLQLLFTLTRGGDKQDA